MTDGHETEFRYHETAPSADIAHLAICFFEFTVFGNPRAPLPHEVFPDGCVSLLYRRNERLGINLLLVKGLSFEPFCTEVFADDIHWGVRFAPAAAAKILRIDPTAIETQPIFNDEALSHLTKGLLPKLVACDSFQGASDVFREALTNLKLAESEIDDKVAEAVNLIAGTKGDVRIAEVARSIELSPRQLERRFRRSSGITPKQFSRVCRLRATAVNMLEDNMNWANRAAEMGFSDQAHLIREFSSLTRHSPKAFEKKVRRVQHNKLVD